MAATDHLTRQQPPAEQADRVIGTFRRISWQRIEVDGDGHGRCLVHGIRHRLPSTLEVSLETGYELRRRGVRTVVHVDGSA
jgi:hypothetical protein